MEQSTVFAGLPTYGLSYYAALNSFVNLKNPKNHCIIIAGEDGSGHTLYQIMERKKTGSQSFYIPKADEVYQSLVADRISRPPENEKVLTFYNNIQKYIEITGLPVKASDTKSLSKFDGIRSHEEAVKIMDEFLDRLDLPQEVHTKESLEQLCEEIRHMDDETIRLLFKWTEVSKKYDSDSDRTQVEIIEKLIPKFEMLDTLVQRNSSSPKTVTSASSVEFDSASASDTEEDPEVFLPYNEVTASRSYSEAEDIMKFVLDSQGIDPKDLSYDDLADLFQECCDMDDDEIRQLVNDIDDQVRPPVNEIDDDEVVIDFTKLSPSE